MTNPFDQVKVLQAQLEAAHETIADLKNKIADLTADNNDELSRLILHYKIKPAEAKILLLLAKAKGQTKNKYWLVTNSRGTPCEKYEVHEPYAPIIDVHVCRLRAKKLPIKNNWGLGFYIDAKDCKKILTIARGQTNEGE